MARDVRLGSDPLQWLTEAVPFPASSGPGEPLARPLAAPPDGAALDRFLDLAAGVSWSPARLIESARLAICVTALDGRLAYANPAFLKLTGYAAHEALVLCWQGDLCQEVREGEEEQVRSALLAGAAPLRQTLLLRPRRGRPLAVEADRHLGLDENGNPACFFTFVHPPRQEAAAAPEPTATASQAAPASLPPDASPAVRQALQRVLAALSDATGAAPPSLAEFERCLADRAAALDGSPQEGTAVAQGILGGLCGLLAARGCPPEALRAEVQAACGPLPLETALLVECIVFDLVHGRLAAAPLKKRPAAVRVAVCDGQDDRLRLTVSDDGKFFAKLKLHDRKGGGLSALAGAIIRRGGSIFLIRTDVTELRISLPR